MLRFVLAFLAIHLALPAVAAAEGLPELRAGFAAALERTAGETGSCVPGPDSFDDEAVQLVWTWRRDVGRTFGDYAEVVVRVSSPDTTLLLLSPVSVLWRLEPQDGARIDTVVVFGSRPSLVTGLAEGTRVFSFDFDANGEPKESCPASLVTDDPWWAFDSGALWTGSFSDALAAYMGRPVDSIVRVPPESAEAGVGPEAIARTAEVRRTGEAMLEYLAFPVPELAGRQGDAPTEPVPEGLSAREVRDWLLESGLAISAPERLLDFLCLREVAQRKLRGIDYEMKPVRGAEGLGDGQCRSRWFWEGSDHLILLAPIDTGRDHECPQGGRLTLHLPDGVDVQGNFANCDISIDPLSEP